MRVLFTVGYQSKPFNYSEYKKDGIGGSEYCVINLANEFNNNKNEVVVTGEVINETINGIKYVDYT